MLMGFSNGDFILNKVMQNGLILLLQSLEKTIVFPLNILSVKFQYSTQYNRIYASGQFLGLSVVVFWNLEMTSIVQILLK